MVSIDRMDWCEESDNYLACALTLKLFGLLLVIVIGRKS